ncbi:unnamed protein product [Paramecium octaurelia]|uniref:Uncharacterized protein n=1 Tax=Paramecium octaurelia TaxID=43137 RepID=A0A8S1T9W7_PAROT|nr:unnamed protein product [Paramecium octaurelia]
MSSLKSFVLFSSLLFLVFGQTCIDHSGNAIDWWFILKMPTDKTFSVRGMDYLYCDANNNCGTFDWQTDQLDDLTSPLQRTIAQIDFHDDNVMSVLWSDQPWNKNTISDRAHSKGILSANINGDAFLISHSTPTFPMLDDAYDQIVLGMPSSSQVYGQHYMCLSITTTEANRLATEYIIAETLTNRANSPAAFATAFPQLYQLKTNSRTKTYQTESGTVLSAALQDSIKISSKGGFKLTAYSKNENLVEDFYADVVAPALGVDLIMETWGNGTGGLQDPVCDQVPKSYSNLVRQHGAFSFSYTKDHSKYGLTATSNNVCFCDLNRQTTQQKRGGVVYCFQHNSLWSIINQSFISRQSC